MKPIKKESHARSILAHAVLIALAFLCLFFFYILLVNSTRSHAELQKGFSALPSTHFLENFRARFFADYFKLIYSRGTIDVAGDQKGLFALFFEI